LGKNYQILESAVKRKIDAIKETGEGEGRFGEDGMGTCEDIAVQKVTFKKAFGLWVKVALNSLSDFWLV
jgi:hypothetical protein